MIHLVSYGTSKFRHRQIILNASALANRVVDTVDSWNPDRLIASGFCEEVPDIKLDERGSGFWAWKPYIILDRLKSVNDGEIVFYCDVGRRFPYIQLQYPLDPFIHWMEEKNQDIMPGVYIPWNGPMSMWTKRSALLAMNMDCVETRTAIPIQASFSLWRNSRSTRELVGEWMSLCAQRNLVSDDPSDGNLNEHPDFREHRHDQSLLNLCCLKHKIRGIDIGMTPPPFNERDPGAICSNHFNISSRKSLAGGIINGFSIVTQSLEHYAVMIIRKMRNSRIKFRQSRK